MGKDHKSKEDMDDITLDFSWFKNLFSKQPSKDKKSDEEDMILDFSKIVKYLSKYFVIILILIPLLLSIHIRTIPANLPIAEDWARQSIHNSIRNQIANEVGQKYPNLPQQQRDIEINKGFNQILSQQYQAIENTVVQQANLIRDRFRDNSGYTYLGDIDSYFWMRYAKNIVEKGHPGDELREGKPFDNHMAAPEGIFVQPNLYPYVEAFLFKFLRLIIPDISIMVTAFYTPLLLSFFSIIAAFFIGKKLSGNFGGFLAAMLITVNPTILSRSLGSDNDIVNAVFPLIIMLFTLLAFDTKSYKKLIIYSVLAGFFTGFYSFAWSGWWFMFLFIIGATIIYLGYIFIFSFITNGKNLQKIFKSPKIRLSLWFLGIFFVTAFVSLSIFGNSNLFFRSFFNPLDIVRIKQAAQGTSIWPNVYTTVAELNAANVPQIIGNLGGKFFFWIALVGTILSLVNLKNENKTLNHINIGYLIISGFYFFVFIQIAMGGRLGIVVLLSLMSLPLFTGLLLSVIFNYEIKPKHSILTVIWFIATIYAATKGVRFILLIVPAFVISFSTFFSTVTDWFTKSFSKLLDISYPLLRSIFILVILLLLFNPLNRGSSINQGINTARNYVPSVSDAWVNSLEKIKLESQQDAIINSWWDFGHWFKFWADRAVTSDGASQNDQNAHWVGKVLLTNDEDQAIAILRMLDCGGQDAEVRINKITKDNYRTVQMIYRLLEMNEEEAINELTKHVSADEASQITSTLFCEPPENYFITSQDMVGKSGVWAHFGSWNFERAKLYGLFNLYGFDDFVITAMQDLNYSQEEARSIYYEINALTTDRQVNDWIAPWPSYGGGAQCSQISNDTIQCNLPAQGQVIPLQINLTTKEAFVQNNQERFYPNSFGYFEEDIYKTKSYDEKGIGYSIVLHPNERTVSIMAEELVGSMFTRLFFLDGQGLRKFNKFHDETSISGGRIITWKVDWHG